MKFSHSNTVDSICDKEVSKGIAWSCYWDWMAATCMFLSFASVRNSCH